MIGTHAHIYSDDYAEDRTEMLDRAWNAGIEQIWMPNCDHETIDGMLELFNIFNRANYGSYVTDEASSQFGQPEYNANLAYAPRTLQLGFRLMF